MRKSKKNVHTIVVECECKEEIQKNCGDLEIIKENTNRVVKDLDRRIKELNFRIDAQYSIIASLQDEVRQMENKISSLEFNKPIFASFYQWLAKKGFVKPDEFKDKKCSVDLEERHECHWSSLCKDANHTCIKEHVCR